MSRMLPNMWIVVLLTLTSTLCPTSSLIYDSDGMIDYMTLQQQVANLTLLVNQLSGLHTLVYQLQAQNAALLTQLNTLNATLARHKVVAFTAQLSNDIVQMGQHQQVVFDKVLSNAGHGYDVNTGHFTAPYSGYYAFYMTITNIGQHQATLRMVKNGRALLHSQVKNDNATTMDTVTHVAMVHLDQNDQVWVQNEGIPHGHEGVTGSLLSSFSGHMIAPRV